ncbi:ribonuclease HI family protein [Patescibacteria group bacterium]|nr:ribonuclease HI family protein [Patescibacteria group bacterium]
MKLIIYTDGCSKGNPGRAGAGVVIYNDKKQVIKEIAKFLGVKTNNQAEYEALIIGLNQVRKMKATQVDCYLDSQLVVNHINGKYKIKNPELGFLFIKVWNLCQVFDKINFYHIPREKNYQADKMANQAMKRT